MEVSYFLLGVLLIFSVSLCASKEDGQVETLDHGKEESITPWIGVDNQFGMFDKPRNESIDPKISLDYQNPSDDFTSDEDYPLDYSIPLGNIDRVTKNVTLAPIQPIATETKKKPAQNPATQPPQVPVEDKQQEKEEFVDDEDEDKIPSIPSDGDADADKYLNPEQYKDELLFHRIADTVNRVWTVNYERSNLPCIMLRADIRVIVPDFDKDFVEINVPPEAEATGTCYTPDRSYQDIKLRWNVTNPQTDQVYENSIYFGFVTDFISEYSDVEVPADKYALHEISLAYNSGELDNGVSGLRTVTVSDLAVFMTPMNESMSCYSDNQLIIGGIQLTMKDLQLEAFRPELETLTVGEFSRSVLCDSDEGYIFDAVMTYIIWFWIGALLLVLFIFGLLLAMGYRRRQCQQQEGGFGYKILRA